MTTRGNCVRVAEKNRIDPLSLMRTCNKTSLLKMITVIEELFIEECCTFTTRT